MFFRALGPLPLALSLLPLAVRAEGTKPEESWNLHAQGTTITQEHAPFRSPYTGVNSFGSGTENSTSLTSTLFAGARLWRGAEAYLNPELEGGAGLSSTLGIAGFPNGEAYRVDSPEPKWNWARMYVRQDFGLGGESEYVESDANALAGYRDSHRLTLTVGRFGLTDFFDDNVYSHDARTQFMNWALVDSGAWDYAADTHGYTWGFVLEYFKRPWTLRWAEALEPKEANQLAFERDPSKAIGTNFEVTHEHKWLGLPGKAGLLAYANEAHMGSYREAIDTTGAPPDVTRTRAYRMKYGFGLSAEQAFTADLGGFVRASWNDGHSESWAYAEIDRSFAFGASLRGSPWSRAGDALGAAFVMNGLSRDHADYLRAGGHGFMIGDGALNYGWEQIVEIYYLWKPIKDLGISPDFQFVRNPAYNADRGPIFIPGFRVHAEI